MKMFEISLRSVVEVKNFVEIASVQPFDIMVGSDDYWVDGKSFMQIFCLNLSQAQRVQMECTDEEFQQFYDAAAKFRN